MSHTDGFYEMDTPNPDGQIFIGASEFKDINGVATYASAGEGLFTLNLGSAAAASFFANVTALLRRTGVYATPSRVQEQFGTAASVPGPTTVANTSGPEATSGYPPYLAAQLPTLTGPITGPIPKGFQVNSLDVIYDVETVNLSLAQCSLVVTQFTNLAAPSVTNRIALAANGLPVAFAAGVAQLTNVPVPSPVFSTAQDGETIVHVNLTAGAGGTAKFYGVVLRVSFNLN
jgi:hypothetical protein